MPGRSVARRVKKHRDTLRAAGFRPVQIWVPDTRAPGFAEECRARPPWPRPPTAPIPS